MLSDGIHPTELAPVGDQPTGSAEPFAESFTVA